MSNGPGWLLLVHHIPPKPPYLRAKVMRRLAQLGAVPLKRSAYLLPAGEAAIEDFEWLREEIRAEGGDAWILEGRFVAGLSDEKIRENFRAVREADYRAVEAEARAMLDRVRERPDEQPGFDAERRRLVRRVEAIRRIDFFEADGRTTVETLMSSIERLTSAGPLQQRGMPDAQNLKARTWATRAGVKVDRMASAWLIRRFIDPAASFVFVPPGAAAPADALRFDMFEGEFTHDGNRCTFEVLLDVCSRADDRGLAALAQIVHDLDLRDDRYQRAEAAGVAALVEGLVSRFDDDHRRIAESAPFFDTLYASLGGAHAHSPSAKG
jgi:hypothetical protein